MSNIPPLPKGYKFYKNNPNKSIFKELGAIYCGKHSGGWKSLADHSFDSPSSLVFAIPNIDRIEKLEADLAMWRDGKQPSQIFAECCLHDKDQQIKELEAKLEKLPGLVRKHGSTHTNEEIINMITED